MHILQSYTQYRQSIGKPQDIKTPSQCCPSELSDTETVAWLHQTCKPPLCYPLPLEFICPPLLTFLSALDSLMLRDALTCKPVKALPYKATSWSGSFSLISPEIPQTATSTTLANTPLPHLNQFLIHMCSFLSVEINKCSVFPAIHTYL